MRRLFSVTIKYTYCNNYTDSSSTPKRKDIVFLTLKPFYNIKLIKLLSSTTVISKIMILDLPSSPVLGVGFRGSYSPIQDRLITRLGTYHVITYPNPSPKLAIANSKKSKQLE